MKIRFFWIRCALAILFAYTAVGKLNSEADTVTIYGSSPKWVQTSVPYAELALAGWLLSGLFSASAALTSIAALSLFSGVIGVELGKERPKPCGCSGTAAEALSPAEVRQSLYLGLSRNVALMAAAGYLFFASSSAGGRAGGGMVPGEPEAIGDAEPSSP